jgi:mannosylglycerate hydrolase MGH1-like protein
VAIADAMNTLGGTGLWDDADGFYYDQLHLDTGMLPLKVRSMVGLIPLYAVVVLDEEAIRKLPGFSKRMNWLLKNRSDLARHISYYETLQDDRAHAQHLLAIPSRPRLEHVLRYMLDENEFLSEYGIRSVSRFHARHPYIFRADGQEFRVDYLPGESNNTLFGGNSNWRGPIWFPVNYLLIEALERYHHFYGQTLRVECPTGSGKLMNLQEVADELSRRLAKIFLPDASGRRPCHGTELRYANDPHWRDLVLFYEYFHGDNGRGVGASHQTGWTSLVSQCLEDGTRRAQQRAGTEPKVPAAAVTAAGARA